MTVLTPDPRRPRPGASRGRRAATPRCAGARATRAGTARQRLPDLDADEILDALADDVMAEGDLAEALRRLHGARLAERTTRPGRDMPGLHDLMDRLRAAPRGAARAVPAGRRARRHPRSELDEIVAQERAGVERRLERAGAPASAARRRELDRAAAARDLAARRLDRLDALPPDVGGRIRDAARLRLPGAATRASASTSWSSGSAGRCSTSTSQGMADAIRTMTPGGPRGQPRDGPRPQQLLQRAARRATSPDVDEFLAQARRLLPGRPDPRRHHRAAGRADGRDAVADALADARAARRAPGDDGRAAARRPAALGPGPARREPRPAAARRARRPASGSAATSRWRSTGRWRSSPASRRSSGSRTQLDGRRAARATSPTIDRDEVRELARRRRGPRPRRARRPRPAPRGGRLPERDGDRLELTPRGHAADRPEGARRPVRAAPARRVRRPRLDRAGRGGEREETTKPYEFGDPFHLDLRGTLGNALMRDENAPPAGRARRPRRPPAPGRLRGLPDRAADRDRDRAAGRHEPLDAAARLLPGRQEGRDGARHAHPDAVPARPPLVIGFAYYAREIRPGALAELSWHGYEYGTNLQHGLLLARRILARQAAANKEIVVITDGEPTAHFEDGQVEFSYPPTRRTIRETLREVQRCTKEGITINTFMLERSRALAEFVEHMTRAQPRPGVLRRPRSASASTCWSTSSGRRSKRVS